MTIKTVHNIETGEITEVEMTKAELDQLAADNKKMEEEKESLLAKSSAKTEILNKLGISAEEAALLLQ
jgi:hypothetical protein